MTSNQSPGQADSSRCLDPLSAPTWLTRLAVLIFDSSDDSLRQESTQRFRLALQRLNGTVPFRLFHDWHANSVSPLLIENFTQRGLSVQEHEDVRKLHHDAWLGRNVPEEAWRAALQPSLHALHLRSYPYDEAYSLAANAAGRFARLHGYSEDDAAKYGRNYAELNTGANARLFSAANARANGRAYAAAFSRSDHDLLAQAYPESYIRACVSLAGAESSGNSVGYAWLGNGLIESMQRC